MANLHLNPIRGRKHFAALLLLLPAIVFVLVLVSVLARKAPEKKPSPEEFVPQKISPEESRWAKDPQVLLLEEKVANEQSNISKNLEHRLQPPLLDYKVEVEEK